MTSIEQNNPWLDKFNDEHNLATKLQEIYTSLNKKLNNFTEIISLRDAIIVIIRRGDLQRTEVGLSFKIYYKTLQQLNIKVDCEFLENFKDCSYYEQPFILNAVLFSNFQHHYEQSYIKEICSDVFLNCVLQNSKNLIIILKALNLFNKRYPKSIIQISIENIYFCLQNSNGFRVRDEILQLFESIVKNSITEANEVAYIALDNISWTNKNKFYLLSIIFKVHSFQIVKNAVEFSNEDFFEGMRLSLKLKRLFSAGQYLVKSLSNQNIDEFNELIFKIFKSGTERELINLNYQWWRYIQNGDKIYSKLNIEDVFDNICQLPSKAFRYILICYLFRQNILKLNENIFYKILRYYMNNFKQFCNNSQLFIYKYIVESFSSINSYTRVEECGNLFEDILNFLLSFLKDNMFNCFPEFRQTILEKIPDIINYISKQFCISLKNVSAEAESCKKYEIETFFIGIKEIYEYGISCQSEYQPLIFSLKLINQILNIFYSKSKKNISKNCNIPQNQLFVVFLNEKRIFDFKIMQEQLLKLLSNESVEYDDVQNLIIKTITLLQLSLNDDESINYNKILEQCKLNCKNSDYDKCSTAPLFVSLIIDCYLFTKSFDIKEDLHKFCLENLTYSTEKFEKDPFYMCKNGYHLFGFINCLNQLYSNKNRNKEMEFQLKSYKKIINISLYVNKTILEMLKIASKNLNENTSASFEIMDESLKILIENSKLASDDNLRDRKYLLLSFWTTLKATCDIATTIASNILNSPSEDEALKLNIYEKCLDININVLYKCRHKGAIEAAGVSLGLLTKHTTNKDGDSKFYKLLFKCFDVLFGSVSQNSLTRRGAGLTIMFHHLLKNDMHKSKLLFHYAIKTLMLYVQKSETPLDKAVLKVSDSGENFDALILHYLCVLVKDTELKEYVVEYYDDIMMAAIRRIEHREWCVRNAALQLFGGLTPKIVGQKQCGEIDMSFNWDLTEITLREVLIKLPNTLFYMLEYYTQNNNEETNVHQSRSTIILFLEFLSKIEYLKLSLTPNYNNNSKEILKQYRETFWKLLSHKCEKIRKLSATCFIRLHNFADEITTLILNFISLFYSTTQPNFEQGIIFCLIEGINKIKIEKFLSKNYEDYFMFLRTNFEHNYKYKKLSYYIRIKLLDLLILLEFDLKSQFVLDSIFDKISFEDLINDHSVLTNQNYYDFGYSLWYDKIKEIFFK